MGFHTEETESWYTCRLKHPPVTTQQAESIWDVSTMKDLVKCVGGCVPLFFIALVFDVIGLILLFVGIFANLRIDGRFYGDFLIYTGSLIIFFSLGCWLMWYVGNVQVSEEGEGPKKRSSFVLLARKLSERLGQKLKGEERIKCVEDEENCSQVGTPPSKRKASRVTWGKSTAYHNEGYDDSLDSTAEEKKREETEEEKQEF
ncbi:uncharacterized protein tmem238l [Symphorus nematophorus]